MYKIILSSIFELYLLLVQHVLGIFSDNISV